MGNLREKKIRYLSEIYSNRPGSQTIHAFNRSLSEFGVPAICHHPSPVVTNIARHFDDNGYLKNLFHLSGSAYLVALMWPKAARLFPICYFAEIIPLCFDCWPKDYAKWEKLFTAHRINTAFFTARQSCDYFSSKIQGMRCLWLPEAADPKEYTSGKPLDIREIDVLELGRRYNQYHDAIRLPLKQKGITHLYNFQKGGRLFETKDLLMEAWENTKISICFPKSVTSKIDSGGVETVTFRYFESMASRCILLGKCPDELQDIYGYNPVIDVDMSDPVGQVLDILGNLSNYQALVDKNYQNTLELGSWVSRSKEMLKTLNSIGYKTDNL